MGMVIVLATTEAGHPFVGVSDPFGESVVGGTNETGKSGTWPFNVHILSKSRRGRRFPHPIILPGMFDGMVRRKAGGREVTG